MGLDTTHGCWHGSYAAFDHWRKKIAEVAGLPPLMLMEGFWEKPEDYNTSALALTIRVAANALSKEHGKSLINAFDFQPIKWSALKPSPLFKILNHSDCEGDIPWKFCKKIADSLEDLIPLLPDEDASGHIGNWREKTAQFVKGLRAAHAAKEDVVFY